MTCDRATSEQTRRRGSILLTVLVIIMLLTLGGYLFVELMISERSAAMTHTRAVETRALADSGVEYAAALLGDPINITEENYYHNPEMFQGVLVHDNGIPGGQGRFSIIAPVENDVNSQQVRFGFIDESGKLNLNSLMKLGLEDDQLRTMLMYLPNMTEDVADAILDWLDEDTIIDGQGAEDETYGSMDPPYWAKNGPLESLEELLLVRGVTPALLFGEDANRNGLLDLNENDGEATAPFDNADGVLDLGWSAYLTIYSRETNSRADGSAKINLNESLLSTLYDDLLESGFTEDETQFIVAFRLYGPSNVEEEEEEFGGGPTGVVGSGSTGDDLTAQEEEAMQQFSRGIAGVLTGGAEGQVTRGGLDLTQGASTDINSIYDLVDAEVEGEVDGMATTLASPWSSADMQAYMPTLMEELTTTDDPFIEGRINVNQARLEVLLGIPDMPEDVAHAIVNSQMIGSGGEPLTDTIGYRATTAWLVMDSIVDLPLMRKLDRYLTTRGDVYRVQVVGHHDAGGTTTRVEAVIDATELPPKVTFVRDLTPLGPGYTSQHFGVPLTTMGP